MIKSHKFIEKLGRRCYELIDIRKEYCGYCLFFGCSCDEQGNPLCDLFKEPILRSVEQGDWYRCCGCLEVKKVNKS